MYCKAVCTIPREVILTNSFGLGIKNFFRIIVSARYTTIPAEKNLTPAKTSIDGISLLSMEKILYPCFIAAKAVPHRAVHSKASNTTTNLFFRRLFFNAIST